jgi:PII-like signaling protein
MPSSSAQLLRIHVSESDTHNGQPLYEAIVRQCREMRIAGATVFRSLEGYGETAEMHKHPIVIAIVDSSERLAALTPIVEAMMHTGIIAISSVHVTRVQKS